MLYINNNAGELTINFDNYPKFNSLLRSVGEEEIRYNYSPFNKNYLPDAKFSIAPNGKYKFYSHVIKTYRSQECMEKCSSDRCCGEYNYTHRRTNFDIRDNEDMDNHTIDYSYRQKINKKFYGINRSLKVKF